MSCNCIIDCRENEKAYDRFLTLNLGGRYVMQWPIDTALESGLFDRVYVRTDSAFIAQLCGKIYPEKVLVINDTDAVEYPKLIISGRAPFIKADTIAEILERRDGRNMRSWLKLTDSPDVLDFLGKGNSIAAYKSPAGVFVLLEGGAADNARCKRIPLLDTEGLVINTRNDFEYALLLMQMEHKRETAKKALLDRIQEKAELFESAPADGAEGADGIDTIGLIGHSQLDNWDTEYIGGYKVLNYGIRGINSFEYYDHILKEKKLKLVSDIYLVMHGTNDIVCEYTYEEMLESIMRTVGYIREQRPAARIFFLCCAHVNGRLDRSNLRIDEFNRHISEHMPSDITLISLEGMDDEFGNLESSYTIDGLHFSEKGYEKLKDIILDRIKDDRPQ